MTDLRKAAEMALEALESCDAQHASDGGRQYFDDRLVEPAVIALRAALAQPSIKDTRDEEIALLREEIKRLRLWILEGDAAAAENAVAAERERYEREVRALQFQVDELKYEYRNLRARGESK